MPKITELTPYTTPQGTDLLAIVDLANTTTKKVTLSAAIGAIPPPAPGTTGQVMFANAGSLANASNTWIATDGNLIVGASRSSGATTGDVRLDTNSAIKALNIPASADLAVFQSSNISGTSVLNIGTPYSPGGPVALETYDVTQIYANDLFEFGTVDFVNGITATTGSGGARSLYAGAGVSLEGNGVTLFGEQYTYGNGVGVVLVNAATTLPNGNPTSACYLVYDGAVDYLKYLRPDGTWITLDGGGAGAVPGGSDKQVQFNDAGSFGGTPGVVYDTSNDRFKFSSGFAFDAGSGNTSIVQSSPTGPRVVTVPDATTTLVGHNTTDTLTNKTMVAASNTITDTSAVAGDILKHNGTRFVRFAKGTANQVLTTNGSATDLAWATPATAGSPGGSTTQVQYNSSGAFAADASFTYGSGKATLATALEAGGGTYASQGALRTSNGKVLAAARNAGNSADIVALDTNSSNSLFVGSSHLLANAAGQVNIFPSNLLSLGVGSQQGLQLSSTEVGTTRPIVGDRAGSPWGVHSGGTVSTGDADHTLTATQYANTLIRFSGVQTASRTMTFPAPASALEGYWKIISTTCTGGNSQIVLTIGSGATASIGAAGAQKVGLFWFDSTGVYPIFTSGSQGTSW